MTSSTWVRALLEPSSTLLVARLLAALSGCFALDGSDKANALVSSPAAVREKGAETLVAEVIAAIESQTAFASAASRLGQGHLRSRATRASERPLPP